MLACAQWIYDWVTYLDGLYSDYILATILPDDASFQSNLGNQNYFNRLCRSSPRTKALRPRRTRLRRESAVTPPADSLQHEIHATTAPEPVKQHGLQGFAHIFACGAALFSDGYVNAISGSVGTILRRFYRDTNPPAFDRFTAPWPLQVPSWACSRSESCSIK
ncbi:hypothetical protein CF336_g8584 [Tilletia laevis]|nr:hypothetical protein CF336_g8584 [Tilletia laevis]